jgi:hypothetical protein
LAVKVKEGIRAAGATSNGVQHGVDQRRCHHGHRRHEGFTRQP